MTNELPWQAWLLGAAVAVWIAGFDVLYALFDLDVDRAAGAAVASRRASASARRSPPPACCTLRPWRSSSGPGSACRSGRCTGSVSRSSAVLLAYEHALVSPRDWRRLDTAFFAMNGVISIGFFAFVLADVLM